MSNFGPRDSNPSAASNPAGSRHQIRRSITEVAPPDKPSRHHHHRQLHLRKDRHHEERAPQSASANLYPYRTSIDMPRSEGVTPMMSPDQSRRPSIMLQRDDENRITNVLVQFEPNVDVEEKLREEQEKASSRVEGLKQSLVDLGTFSSSTSRRLDETYYAVLEKTTSLQNTMAALKDLAETSRKIHGDFEKDSREIENDITVQLAKFGQFKEQENNIESLQTRVQVGRAKIESLSNRVDLVRERIESWERADTHWQEKTRKRLKAIWVFVSIFALAMTLMYFGAKYVPPNLDIRRLDSSKVSRLAGSVAGIHNESEIVSMRGESPEATDEAYVRDPSVEGDERLHVFDEL
ncbi:hypothetical protein G7046_g21 [Stylonectria norvegica]|nr:hypothetical protein G7046_g21 [Stylonectria norvegica]